MSDQCPKCAGPLRTQQVANVLSKYCDHCGSLPFASHTKTGEAIRVDRAGRDLYAHLVNGDGEAA